VVYPLLLTWKSNSGADDGKARFALDYSIGILAIAKFPATTACMVSREYNGRDKVSYFRPRTRGPGRARREELLSPPHQGERTGAAFHPF
jgi:hypothetical protein